MAERTRSLDDSAPDALPASSAGGEASDPPVMLGDCLDRYTVRTRIGAGGMGEVFAAHDAELDRMVAIKVIKPGLAGSSPASRARFQREAQAMARLSHPNVVSVYDVGQAGGRVFVAMELVQGPTLAAWMAERPRPWREVVQVFLQAGRGLEAAHAAGVVHRDFKPANVILGERVRVADFGLARAVDAAEEEQPASGPVPRPLEGSVTRTGQAVGTPAYMAPEQGSAGPASPLSDQYAFAVSLHEALSGVRPGESPLRAIPAHLRAILARALSVRPEDRYPSMRELLSDLERDPARSRNRWLAAGGTLGLVALSFWLARGAAHRASCEGLNAPFAAVWNRAKADALRQHFAKSGASDAAVAADHVIAVLDDYATRWTGNRTNACTQAREGVESQDLLDSRMRCLDQRLVEVSTVASELATADAAMIRNAGSAVDRLHPLTDCDDPREAPRPAGAKVRADITEAEALIARAWALEALDQSERSLPLAQQAAEIGERTGWAPLFARALILRADCENHVRDHKAALSTYEQAATLGAQAKDDTVVADALVGRFFVLGEPLGKPGEALAMRRFVELALERAGKPPRSYALWLHNLAVILLGQEKTDEALAAEEEAVAIWRKIVPPGHAYLIQSLETEGNILIFKNEFDRSEKLLREVLKNKIASHGQNDIDVADTLDNLAVLEAQRGNLPGAIEQWEHALEIERSLGNLNNSTAFNLGLAKYAVRRWRAAEADLTMALGVAERSAQGASRYVALTTDALGATLTALGEYDRARAMLDRSIESSRASGAPADEALAHASRLALLRGDRATAKTRLAEAKKAAQNEKSLLVLVEADLVRAESGCRAARPGYELAIRLAKKEVEKSIETDATINLAQCQLELGAAGEAVAALEPLVKWLDDVHADAEAIAPVRSTLARASRLAKGKR
jgi:tetratricopeptide (TPR) repeat protein